MVKYCPKCGYPNNDEALYCVRCGTKLPDIYNLANNQPTLQLSNPNYYQTPTKQLPSQPQNQPITTIPPPATNQPQPNQPTYTQPVQNQPQYPPPPTTDQPPSQPQYPPPTYTQQFQNQPQPNQPQYPPPNTQSQYPPPTYTQQFQNQPYYSYQQSPQTQKKKLPTRMIIGIVAAAAIALVMFLVVIPLLTPNPIMLTTSQAQNIFGGSWNINNGETAFISVSNNQATIYYQNGNQISSPGSFYGITSGKIETLNGYGLSSTNAQPVTLIIGEFTFGSTVSAQSFYDNFTSGLYNAQTSNGYYYYIYNSDQLIAWKGNNVIMITMQNYTPNSQQLLTVLQDVS